MFVFVLIRPILKALHCAHPTTACIMEHYRPTTEVTLRS